MSTFTQKQLEDAVKAAVQPIRAEIQQLKSTIQALDAKVMALEEDKTTLACVCACVENYVAGVKALEGQRSLDLLHATH